MRTIREILRLSWDCKLSQRQIASSCNIARSSVGEYIRRAQAAGLSWPLPADYDDDEKLDKLLFPPQPGTTVQRPLPDFNEISQKLQMKGATLALFWERYKCENQDGYQYSHFCELYRQWAKTIDVVMRQEHVAGEKLFSDFAGSKLLVTNPHTGEVREAHLFVCALGASSYTYAEAFFSEKSESWCTGHANAFSFMGGSVEIIVPDNPRSVVDKPCPYEPDIHPDFQHMASFFGAAVIPARVKKPRDKAAVEAAVRVATMWIIAVLRDRQFFSLAELNASIRELLERLNNRPFKKLPGSRRTRFETIDKPALKPLPTTPYEYTNIGFARVNLDYHIEASGCLYSVPFQYARKQVEYRQTSKTIEVFLLGRRIASHPRLWIKDSRSTLTDHMPSTHRLYAEWTPQRIIEWATKTGPATAQLVHQIMDRRRYPEQGFRACLGILKLGKTAGTERLELAAQRALAINALSYKHVKLILESKLERLPLPEKPIQLSIVHDNIRGTSAFPSTQTNQ
jgi:transposase